MKNLLFIPLVFLLLGFSCEDSDNLRVDYDLAELEKEIIMLSESVSCTSSNEWKFTPMGSKACGGPIRYIAYHQSIDRKFLALVESFTQKQKSIM